MITSPNQEAGSFSSEAKRMLELITTDLPYPIEAEPNLVMTSRVLLDLARTWPGPPGDEQRRDLEALCRKLHVAKKLMAVYAPGWNKIPEAVPLPLPYWSLTIAVLLAYSHLSREENRDARGLGFKFLNAAVAAVDLARSRGTIPHLPELQSWAEKISENLTCQVKV
jgi:hypothetical protein